MPLHIITGDITKLSVDAIVNAANTSLKMGGGVCGAIFLAAGPRELQEECDGIVHCPVGQAVITEGYQSKAKKIIHAVGPIWQGGSAHEEEFLRSAYKSSLDLAVQNDLYSVAFPLISAGIYGYPKEDAFRIARETISTYLMEEDLLVYLVLYDQKPVEYSSRKISELKEYIEEYYRDEQKRGSLRSRKLESKAVMNSVQEFLPSLQESVSSERLTLEELINQMDETFSTRLLKLIDEKGYSDVETYRKANIDRKLFSKIRGDENYRPSKFTALALAIALELDLDETLDLIGRAGYTLSRASRFDLIIEYHIREENYDVHEINESLFTLGEKILV